MAMGAPTKLLLKKSRLLLGLLLGAILGFLLLTSTMQPSSYVTSEAEETLHPRCGGGGNASSSSDQIAEDLLRSLGTSHRLTEASCERLIAGDPAEQAKAQALMQSHEVPSEHRLDERFAATDCQTIRQGYVTKTLSQEEADFPIAFSLVVFKDFYQVEKLFRAVYRPEHFYCFHVDNKSSVAFHQAVVGYSSCFPNVALSERNDIQWGKFSVLQADLSCMKKLLAMSSRWRYFINLTGQEYPLRTMRELVRILKALNGSNNLENAGTHTGSPPLSVKLPDGSKRAIQWYKGSVHITVTRGFVEFAFSGVGQQISDHLHKYGSMPCPTDETFFATLNFNPHVLKVPGADLTGLRTDNVKQPFLNRYKNWLAGVFGYPCLSGNIVRWMCIWGVRDLPAMNRRPEFFVNKFYYNFQRLALQCMVERFWNNTLADYGAPCVRKSHEIPLNFYSKFDFVRQHL